LYRFNGDIKAGQTADGLASSALDSLRGVLQIHQWNLEATIAGRESFSSTGQSCSSTDCDLDVRSLSDDNAKLQIENANIKEELRFATNAH
jgi:hypothetical protein